MASNKKQEAKDWVENKITNAFGNDFITSTGGKIYVWGKAKDGEKVQLAISLTAPANPIDAPQAANDGFDWSDPIKPVETKKIDKMEDEEKENIAKLMAALGL